MAEARQTQLLADDEQSEAGHEPIEVPTAERQLGKYRLLYELGSGGMATVYLGRDETKGLERLVALKRIHKHLSRDKRFVDMFLDEARIVRLINHPNVCSVYDFGEIDGSYFIAMQYLAGRNLAQVLARIAHDSVLASAEESVLLATRVVAQACEGLHAAHDLKDPGGKALNVIHRDVSPQNLLVTYDGTVRVVDFGVARAAGRVQHSRTGQFKGKLSYMAPEQARRETLDRRVDVFALGVVLWEALTLHRLFRRDSELDTILAITEDPIPDPSSVRSVIPSALDAIVLRSLARNPADRYPSTRELGRDLNRFLVQHGAVIGMAEIADFMHASFPEAEEKAAALLQTVTTDGPVTGTVTTPELSRIQEKLPTPAAETKPDRGRRWFAPLMLIVVGAVAGALGIALIPDDSEPTAPVANDVDLTEDEARGDEESPPLPSETSATDMRVEPEVQEAEGTPMVVAPSMREPARPRSNEPATLRVVTNNGWATIAVDGVSHGQTPKLISNLRPGRHQVVLRAAGTGPPIRRNVNLQPGRTRQLAVDS